MKTILEHIDTVANNCGYFTTQTNVNNGYGCNHPEQEETDIDSTTCKEQGKCYCFSCPLGQEADEEDFIAHGENPDEMNEGEWIVMEENWSKNPVKH